MFADDEGREVRGISYPKNDKVRESLSVSLVRLKVDNSLLQHIQSAENEHIQSAENEHEFELKQKLKQANLRYFARFKDLATVTA